jgi:hypothetical protein
MTRNTAFLLASLVGVTLISYRIENRRVNADTQPGGGTSFNVDVTIRPKGPSTQAFIGTIRIDDLETHQSFPDSMVDVTVGEESVALVDMKDGRTASAAFKIGSDGKIATYEVIIRRGSSIIGRNKSEVVLTPSAGPN